MATEDDEHDAIGNAGRVTVWLASAAGGHAVRAALREMRLPDLFDTDLETQTIRAAERMDQRGEVIEEVGAWCRQVLRWRALDLFRSPVARRATDPAPDDASDGVPAIPDGGEQVAADLEVEAVRRGLGRHWSPAAAWQLSAALTYLTIALEDGVPGPARPAPQAGADELDRAHWAALHYAGLHDCFARVGEADTPARRQRRTRRIAEVRRLLTAAYAATHEGPRDD